VAPTPPLNDGDWTRLTETLEAFSDAWGSASYPPSIVDFLPETESPLRMELVPELIKLDLEQRWQMGLRKLLEDYADDVPELDTLMSVDLVFEEYHIRKTAGDRVSPTEYFKRFPGMARDLDGLFRMDPALRSTFVAGASPAAVMELSPGETIDDFEILLQLGRGTFATVFLARQKSMQRLVALKVSADHGSEPQTLAQLDHDNIIRVYDQRVLSENSARLLYMQYAAGGTLADVIHRIKNFPQKDWNGRTYLKAIDSILDDRGESRPTESETRRRISGMNWTQLVCWVRRSAFSRTGLRSSGGSSASRYQAGQRPDHSGRGSKICGLQYQFRGHGGGSNGRSQSGRQSGLYVARTTGGLQSSSFATGCGTRRAQRFVFAGSCDL